MHKIPSVTKKQWLFVFFICLAFSLWFLVIFSGDNQYADESTHYRQIRWFLKGNYGLRSDLTTIPGYHAGITLLAKASGSPSPQKIRVISLLVSSLSIFVFFIISKTLKSADPIVRTLQFVFLPVSFFYFPLIYTDIVSLLMVLSTFYFLIKRQYALSAIFAFASLLVRQNNIVWILFFWAYQYVSVNGFPVSRQSLLDYAKRTFGYVPVFLAFALFVSLNKGIAIGDAESHQAGFHMGNIYFFLALSGVLFLPLLIASMHRFDALKTRNFLVFGVGIGTLAAASFIVFPPVLHMYNFKLAFLRNIILQGAYHQYAWIYASAILIGYLAIFLMKFERKDLYLFPFIAVSLLPSLLVEQRYAIIPLAFILLLRRDGDRKTEYAMVPYFLALSVGLIYTLLESNLFF